MSIGATSSNPIEPAPAPCDTWSDGLPVLVDDEVVLREVVLADAPSLVSLLTTDEVTRFISPPPMTEVGFRQFILWAQQERHAGRSMCLGIVPTGQSAAVGLIQVRRLDPAFDSGEWGFALGRPYWGTGLFRKTSCLALDFLFREVAVHRLEARAATRNGRGNMALLRLGAEPNGVLRKSLGGRGQHEDQVLWSLLAEDWLGREQSVPRPRQQSPLTTVPEAAPDPPAEVRAAPQWRRQLPILHGKRVLLRELIAADAPALVRELSQGTEVRQFIPTPPESVEEFERYIAWSHRQRAKGYYVCYGIVPIGQDEPVGICQLQNHIASCQTAEWGFAIGRNYWGTGLFMEGADLMLDFVFNIVGVRRLEARAATQNVRGNAVLRKTGAVREGYLRRSFLLDGQYFDDALWALLDEDWRNLRQTSMEPTVHNA